MHVGLRIDVDTLRGTKKGVPRLLNLLNQYNIKATFFFSVGPDNMGRHLWRLTKPKFFWKMLRSNAANLYGWDILLAGTAWPGKIIGKHTATIIRETQLAGHEIGLHAWDHYGWQKNVERWNNKKLLQQINHGYSSLSDIIGERITCSAVAGWRANQNIIELKELFNFKYNSDCRGTSIFNPILKDGSIGTTQIPVTLPTFDEVIGSKTSPQNFNNYIINKIAQQKLNVYTIHAEVEGINYLQTFKDLLIKSRHHNINYIPLKNLITNPHFPTGTIIQRSFTGREGWIGVQKND